MRHRSVFGAKLIDQPLMRNVIADLGLESEAATTLALRLAGAADRARRGDAQERAFLRLATAVGKYWVCKRQPAAVAEALECLGGNGYDEASGMPRLYREAPLNGIWEGSGNVNALDMLRALTREPESLDAFRTEVESAAGADRRLDTAWRELQAELVLSEDAPLRARRVIERAALVLQGSLLVRHAPAAVADAFCASRLMRRPRPRFRDAPARDGFRGSAGASATLSRAGGSAPGPADPRAGVSRSPSLPVSRASRSAPYRCRCRPGTSASGRPPGGVRGPRPPFRHGRGRRAASWGRAAAGAPAPR